MRRAPGSRDGEVSWFRPVTSSAVFDKSPRRRGPRNYAAPSEVRVGSSDALPDGVPMAVAAIMALAALMMMVAVVGLLLLPGHVSAARSAVDGAGVHGAVEVYAAAEGAPQTGLITATAYAVALENVAFADDVCKVRLRLDGPAADSLDVDVSVLDRNGEPLPIAGSNRLSHELAVDVDMSKGTASMLVGVPCTSDVRHEAHCVSVSVRDSYGTEFDREASVPMVAEALAAAGA